MPGRGKERRKSLLMETEQWLCTTRSKMELEMISTWDIPQVLPMRMKNKMVMMILKIKKLKIVKRKKKSTPLETQLKSLEPHKSYMMLN
jgi:hypothetical protein